MLDVWADSQRRVKNAGGTLSGVDHNLECEALLHREHNQLFGDAMGLGTVDQWKQDTVGGGH
jgi:hypothetical protein